MIESRARQGGKKQTRDSETQRRKEKSATEVSSQRWLAQRKSRHTSSNKAVLLTQIKCVCCLFSDWEVLFVLCPLGCMLTWKCFNLCWGVVYLFGTKWAILNLAKAIFRLNLGKKQKTKHALHFKRQDDKEIKMKRKTMQTCNCRIWGNCHVNFGEQQKKRKIFWQNVLYISV